MSTNITLEFGAPKSHKPRECTFEIVPRWMCGVRHDTDIGSFFIHEKSVDTNVYAVMLENYVISELEDTQSHVFFQQDRALPHSEAFLRELLNRHFPYRWILRCCPIPWLSQYLAITIMDFFLWVYVKDQIFVTPVLKLLRLRKIISLDIQSVIPHMLLNVWHDNRLDTLCVTCGGHTKCLK